MLSALRGITTCLTATVTTEVAITAFTGYDATVMKTASRARISARTTGAMFTYNGTTPSATVGHLVAANATVLVEGQANIAALKFIQESGGNAVITITLETDQS